MELLVIGREYLNELREFRRGSIRSPERPSRMKLWLEIVGAALVAVGVAGEFIVHIRAGKVETDIRDVTRQQVAIANGEASAANERAAVANRIAERERLARLQLEARLAPRSLSQGQQDNIHDRLRAFGHRDVDVFLFGDTPEIGNIAGRIINSCIAVPWTVRVWSVLPGSPIIQGILVMLRSGPDRDAQLAANGLVTALQANGLEAGLFNAQFADGVMPWSLNGPPWDNNTAAPIRLLIGAKP